MQSKAIWRREHVEALEKVFQEIAYASLRNDNEAFVQLGRREVVNYVKREYEKLIKESPMYDYQATQIL